MRRRTPPLCMVCKHYTGGKKYRTCRAFKNWIPWQLWDNRIPHFEEFPGDEGYRFDTDMKEAAELNNWLYERYKEKKRKMELVGAREERLQVVTRLGVYRVEDMKDGTFQTVWHPKDGDPEVLPREFTNRNDAKDAAWEHYWSEVERLNESSPTPTKTDIEGD